MMLLDLPPNDPCTAFTKRDEKKRISVLSGRVELNGVEGTKEARSVRWVHGEQPVGLEGHIVSVMEEVHGAVVVEAALDGTAPHRVTIRNPQAENMVVNVSGRAFLVDLPAGAKPGHTVEVEVPVEGADGVDLPEWAAVASDVTPVLEVEMERDAHVRAGERFQVSVSAAPFFAALDNNPALLHPIAQHYRSAFGIDELAKLEKESNERFTKLRTKQTIQLAARDAAVGRMREKLNKTQQEGVEKEISYKVEVNQLREQLAGTDLTAQDLSSHNVQLKAQKEELEEKAAKLEAQLKVARLKKGILEGVAGAVGQTVLGAADVVPMIVMGAADVVSYAFSRPPEAFAEGDTAYALNKRFKDGTRLRQGAARTSPFLRDQRSPNGELHVLNDAKVTVLEVDGEFAKIRAVDGNGPCPDAEGWMYRRNLTHTERRMGLMASTKNTRRLSLTGTDKAWTGEDDTVEEFTVGDEVYGFNPHYKDGTKLRITPELKSDFTGQAILNDAKVMVLELNDDGIFAKVRALSGNGIDAQAEGWMRVRNLTHVERTTGLTS